jgi:hypothetical protein
LFSDFYPNISDKCRNPERVLKVYELAKQGYFSREIAEMLSVTPKSVQKIFRYYNFPKLHNFAPPLREERQGWKGGLKVVKGYEYLRTPDHPHKSKHGGYVAVHRLVVEQHLGRYLTQEEVVDHIDGDTRNNNIENLRVFENNAEHLRVTLAGKVPNWSEDGKKRISEAVRKARKREAANRKKLKTDAH